MRAPWPQTDFEMRDEPHTEMGQSPFGGRAGEWTMVIARLIESIGTSNVYASVSM